MRKIYSGLITAALLAVSLTGCENVSEVTNAVSEVTNTVGEKLGLVSAETETELQDGQRRATIQIVSITGNELTYVELEEETEEESETGTEEAVEETAGTETEEAVIETAETGTEGETEASEEESESGMSNSPENMPSMGDDAMTAAESESEIETEIESEDSGMSDMGGMRGGGQMGGMDMSDMDMSDMAEAFGDGGFDMSGIGEAFENGELDVSDIGEAMDSGGNLSDLVSELTQETTTVYLQVGVVVYTDTGKEKTFSILEAGDELEVLFETDEDGNEVITKMWLTGTE